MLKAKATSGFPFRYYERVSAYPVIVQQSAVPFSRLPPFVAPRHTFMYGNSSQRELSILTSIAWSREPLAKCRPDVYLPNSPDGMSRTIFIHSRALIPSLPISMA